MAISARPMPILQVMGTVDDVFKLVNVQPILDKWIARNECSTRSRLTEPYPMGRTVSQAAKRMWINTNTQIEVVLMTTPKGHWHSNDPAHIMVNQEVWDFCKRYSTDGFIVTSVKNNSANKIEVVERNYFNLLGVRVAEARNGVYVVRDVLADGSVKSYKIQTK